jgi:hypothetical protein
MRLQLQQRWWNAIGVVVGRGGGAGVHRHQHRGVGRSRHQLGLVERGYKLNVNVMSITQGSLADCNEAETPNPLAAGKTFQTCLTFLVPGGITKVAYTGTESYITKPVIWSP